MRNNYLKCYIIFIFWHKKKKVFKNFFFRFKFLQFSFFTSAPLFGMHKDDIEFIKQQDKILTTSGRSANCEKRIEFIFMYLAIIYLANVTVSVILMAKSETFQNSIYLTLGVLFENLALILFILYIFYKLKWLVFFC